jgi:hypothetical protein
MRRNVSEAKQRFSMVVRSAANEPQLIFNRDRLVAAVVHGETLEEFEEWRRQRFSASLGERLAELRQIATEEGYVLTVPERQDRAGKPGGSRRRTRIERCWSG